MTHNIYSHQEKDEGQDPKHLSGLFGKVQWYEMKKKERSFDASYQIDMHHKIERDF